MILTSLPHIYCGLTIFWSLTLSVFLERTLLILWFLYTICFTLFLYTTNWFILLFTWEAISVLSFLLVYNKEALFALQINLIGGLNLLLGVFFENNLFILIAILIKSAQFPFSNWLYKVSSAPHYMSAFFHSVTLVQCGVLLLEKTNIIFSPIAKYIMIFVGLSNIIKILLFPGKNRKEMLVDLTSIMLTLELTALILLNQFPNLLFLNFGKCVLFALLPFISNNAFYAILGSFMETICWLKYQIISYDIECSKFLICGVLSYGIEGLIYSFECLVLILVIFRLYDTQISEILKHSCLLLIMQLCFFLIINQLLQKLILINTINYNGLYIIILSSILIKIIYKHFDIEETPLLNTSIIASSLAAIQLCLTTAFYIILPQVNIATNISYYLYLYISILIKIYLRYKIFNSFNVYKYLI